jgi:predicted ester cyclase
VSEASETSRSTAAVATRLVDRVWNALDEAAAAELVAPHFVGDDGRKGPAGVLEWHRERRRSFPDLRYEIVTVVADDERAAVRWRASGHQSGPFGPVQPTGREVRYQGVTVLRVESGQIVELWSVNELFQLLQQLGADLVPPDGAG